MFIIDAIFIELLLMQDRVKYGCILNGEPGDLIF